MTAADQPLGNSPRPLYRQIQDRILARITRGEWTPGHQVPSENDLVRQLGVSRGTIQKALAELTFSGHLTRVAGKGTFVAEPPRRASLLELRDIAEEIRSAGAEHSSQLLAKDRIDAEGEIARRLEIAKGDPVAHVVLVHRRDGVPIQHEDRWVNLAAAPGFLDADFIRNTPSQYLLASVPAADTMEHEVQAVLPAPEVGDLLEVDAGKPCLRLERRTWSRGRVVTYAVFTYPGSRYSLGARYTPDSIRPR